MHHRIEKFITGHWPGHFQLAKRPVEPVHVIFVIDNLRIEDSEPFIDRIGKQQPAIENRELRLAFGQETAIQKNRSVHDRHSPNA